MTEISPVFTVNSTMLGISAQKSEVSPIKPDRMRVTSQSIDSALIVLKGQQLMIEVGATGQIEARVVGTADPPPPPVRKLNPWDDVPTETAAPKRDLVEVLGLEPMPPQIAHTADETVPAPAEAATEPPQ
jgi:hypothetical protein